MTALAIARAVPLPLNFQRFPHNTVSIRQMPKYLFFQCSHLWGRNVALTSCIHMLQSPSIHILTAP